MNNPDVDPKLTRRQAENHRASIQVGKILERLDRASEGKLELTPVQVKAAQILLDKALPTLQSIDQTTTVETPEMSPDEIEAVLKDYLADLKKRDPAAVRKLIEPDLTLVEPNALRA